MKILKNNPNKEYLIDAFIPFSLSFWDELINKISDIIQDKEMIHTFEKSISTTSNINKRIEIIKKILEGR